MRNMRVNATPQGAIIMTAKGGGVLIEHSEMFSTFATGGSKGVGFDGTSGGVFGIAIFTKWKMAFAPRGRRETQTVVYDNTTNSSLAIGNNGGPVDDVRLEDNRLTGGGYTVRRDGRGQTR